jgi:threonine dehydratase
MTHPVGFDDVLEAADRIRGLAHTTPVMTSRLFDAEAGLAVHFKCENLQCGGAFKIRGASNFVARIPKADLPRGVVAYSSGNHAQAVAIAAARAGVPATIVMPLDAPAPKVEATRAYGARIVTFDRLTEDREAIGARIAAETRATLIPPYDHPWTIAGQGTAALELLEQAPELDALLVPVGGGGLIAGCAIAARGLHPRFRIFGVEPETANDTHLSLRAGRRVSIPPPRTIADGLRAVIPGELPFPIIQDLVEDILLVTDDEISATVEFLLSRMKILVEPSGAVAAAAVLFHKLPAGLRRPGVILSGGNADLTALPLRLIR